MFTDLTLEIPPQLTEQAGKNLNLANFGHLGTHFDVMNKDFPLDYCRRPA